MPIRLSTFLLKSNPRAIPFLVRDVDLSGGFRVVPDASAFDSFARNPEAIHPGARIPGMVVVTQNDMHLHQLQPDGSFLDKGPLGASAFTNVNAPLYVDQDNKLSIEETALLPPDGKQGDFLRVDAEGNPVWGEFSLNPGRGVRVTRAFTPENALDIGQSFDFEMDMGRAVMLVNVALDIANVQVEAFGEPSRGESNPYTFKSRGDQLHDDGSRLLADDSVRYFRRYGFVANKEDPVEETIYWTMTNTGNLPVQPTVTITFTAIE